MGHDFETTLDDVRQALSFLDCTARMTWVTVAFAIKNEFGEAGFGCWDQWSQGDRRYKSKEALAVWKSAGVTGKAGTMGMGGLFDMAKKAGFTFEKKTLTPEQREKLRLEHEARREKVLEQQAADAAWCKKMADVVAAAAADIVDNHVKPVGGCPYIGQKRITPYGALFPREPLILIVDTKNACSRLIVGRDATREYWAHRKTDAGKAAQEYEFSLSMNKGSLVLPMRNMAGQVRNLQVITRAKDAPAKKLFIKCGEKTGTYLRIGDGPAETELATEGWATGCTLHKASGLPVWVTWDCGGLYNWAQEMREQGRGGSEFLICGDDDAATDKNPGKTKALAAATLLGCAAVFPAFPSDLPAGKERSDFNDLQIVSGLAEVTAQVDAGLAKLDHLNLGEASPAPSSNAADFEAPPVDAYNDYADYPCARISV
jgi:putative DNA primase/helicase